MQPQRKVIVIAGPNGAGKTTFAPESAALQAGRLMLQELARHFAVGENFAFETTLSGRGYVSHIQALRRAGYRVKLIFLRLDSADEALARVAQRVQQGGHDIPPDTVRPLCGWTAQLRTSLCAAGRCLGAV